MLVPKLMKISQLSREAAAGTDSIELEPSRQKGRKNLRGNHAGSQVAVLLRQTRVDSGFRNQDGFKETD
jgi:hypothetical protein